MDAVVTASLPDTHRKELLRPVLAMTTFRPPLDVPDREAALDALFRIVNARVRQYCTTEYTRILQGHKPSGIGELRDAIATSIRSPFGAQGVPVPVQVVPVDALSGAIAEVVIHRTGIAS